MEVVAVVHEGDGVTAGGPAHESQVLVVVEIILLKVNEVWMGRYNYRYLSTHRRLWFQCDEVVSLWHPVDNLD